MQPISPLKGRGKVEGGPTGSEQETLRLKNIHSVAFRQSHYFCYAFFSCFTDHWADTAATVQPVW